MLSKLSALLTHLLAQVLPECTDCRHCLQPCWLEGARRHSPPQGGGGGCDLAPCTGIGNLGSKASKTPPLRIRIRQICTPWSPPVRVYPQVSSIGEQSCSLGKQLGICRYKLSLPRSAKIPVMVVASPSPLHHRRSQGLSPTDFPLTS